MNDPHRTAAHSEQPHAGDTGSALIGPPPPEGPGEQTAIRQTAKSPDQSGSESETLAQPIVLQRSTDEPPIEQTGSTGFWDISQVTGGNPLAGILFAGGMVVLVFILLRRLWRGKRNRQPRDLQTPREQIATLRAQAEERDRINGFKIEAHDFTRQLAALLDSKAERLEQLINDADNRLARLAEAEGRRESGSERPSVRVPSRSQNRARSPSLDPPDGADPAHARIYQLADAGMDPVEIAKQTGQPTGQVELILALRG